MLETALGVGTLLTTFLGFALIALSQERHWSAVQDIGTPPPSRPPRWGFAAGIGGLLVPLCAAVASQGPAFGALVWVMELSLAAMAVSLTLSWRPGALRPLALVLRRHPAATN